MDQQIATKRRGYSLESDLLPIIEGTTALPNFLSEDLARTANNIASGGHSMLAKWGWALIDGRKQWAQFFLTPAAMGNANSGSLDGGGYVMVWSSRKEGPITGTFAICRHDKQAAPGANPSRGWHPGRCVKCGLDMTIDSSD
jgi:hypothetical protein